MKDVWEIQMRVKDWGGACSEEGFIYLLLSYISLITALGSTAQNKPHTTVM